jgi:ribosomal protein L22
VAVAEKQQTVRAQAKWVRMSARKGRVVAEHIRGRSVPEARAVLAFTPRAAAREIEKVLASAVANAESRPDLQWHGDDLYVDSIVVDEGPTLKRWRARARGRVARIKKRTCHITVLLAPAAQEGPAGRETRKRTAKPEAETPEAAVKVKGESKASTTEEKPKRTARTREKSKPESEPKPKASGRKS